MVLRNEVKRKFRAVKPEPKIINYDFENTVLGRGATYVAKEILSGNTVNIYNAEKAVINGNRADIFEKYKEKQDFAGKGNPLKGPHYPKNPSGIVRRAIRGMIKHKRAKGMDAYRKLKVFVGTDPAVKMVKLEKAIANPLRKNVAIAEISKFLGAKW
ncbi:MAG: 50S ribosomal protein L13 [Candidatus ainarchaeum sp.]|nr:50S ribosomal protein L13 [Candidatus ainarchaeum sp.]